MKILNLISITISEHVNFKISHFEQELGLCILYEIYLISHNLFNIKIRYYLKSNFILIFERNIDFLNCSLKSEYIMLFDRII